MLAKANAIMKRLRSTETLGSTSAINSDKTGTLTLNQMTAVELTIPGRRYTISGGGYATEGTIKHVFGQPEVPLEQFLLPMALCADAVVKDGELDRRPDRGRARRARREGRPRRGRRRGEQYPRVAELPFDAAYKMMATFHRMQRRERQRRRPLPRQGRARPAARAGGVPARARGPRDRPGRRRVQAALHGRERAAREPGPARDGDRPQGLRPGDVRPVGRPAPAARRHDGARARRHRRPAAAGGEGGDRDRARGRASRCA